MWSPAFTENHCRIVVVVEGWWRRGYAGSNCAGSDRNSDWRCHSVTVGSPSPTQRHRDGPIQAARSGCQPGPVSATGGLSRPCPEPDLLGRPGPGTPSTELASPAEPGAAAAAAGALAARNPIPPRHSGSVKPPLAPSHDTRTASRRRQHRDGRRGCRRDHDRDRDRDNRDNRDHPGRASDSD